MIKSLLIIGAVLGLNTGIILNIHVHTAAQAGCASASLRATGTKYYYCDCQAGADGACVAGNDGNTPCTNPATPCQSIGAASTRFNSMSAGNTVALCRGGAWSGGGVSLGNVCGNTESTFCDFRSYIPSWGSQATARPYWASTGTMVSSDGYGNRFWSINMRATSGSDATVFSNTANGSNPDYLDICDIKIDGNGTTNNTQLINFQSDGNAMHNITVRNSEFRNAPFAALTGSYSGLVVDSNLFQDNGLNGTPQDHHIYLARSGSGNPSNHDIVVKNNQFIADNRCGGVMAVNQSLLNNVSYINNSFVSTSADGDCYGLQFSSSGSTGQFSNIQILRNRFSMTTTTALELACCVNCTASDNICVNCGAWGINAGNGGGAGCVSSESSGGIVQNNTSYRASGATVIHNDSITSGVLASNAVWNGSAGSCYSAGGSVTQAANYCRAGSGDTLGSVFVDAPGGNFTPIGGSPLIAAGSATYYSATAIGTAAWSATDTGSARSPPIDQGAMKH